jgi:hypothetical protein
LPADILSQEQISIVFFELLEGRMQTVQNGGVDFEKQVLVQTLHQNGLIDLVGVVSEVIGFAAEDAASHLDVVV